MARKRNMHCNIGHARDRSAMCRRRRIALTHSGALARQACWTGGRRGGRRPYPQWYL